MSRPPEFPRRSESGKMPEPATYAYFRRAAERTPGFEDVDRLELERVLGGTERIEDVGSALIESFGGKTARRLAVYVHGIAEGDVEKGKGKVAKNAARWANRALDRIDVDENRWIDPGRMY